MRINFGTNPNNIIALIGPAIGLCCYEVSEEVRDKLLSTVQNSTDLYKERNVDLKKLTHASWKKTELIKLISALTAQAAVTIYFILTEKKTVPKIDILQYYNCIKI